MEKKLISEEMEKAYKKYVIESHNIFNSWNPIKLFKDKNFPFLNTLTKNIIEIGPGNCDFLIHLAMENKNNFYIGIEILKKRIIKGVKKSYKRNLNNIKFIHGDARDILVNKKIENNSIDEYYLTFPDPWPKKRHKRNRIMNNEFTNTIYNSLKKDGIFTIATDSKEYLDEMLNSIEYIGKFKYLFENKITNNLDNFYKSYFENLWREKGKEIYYCKLKK